MDTILLFVFGSCLASFFDVIIQRSHHHQIWWRGRSYCPQCHHSLTWYDVIPIISQCLLKNRCRYCHHPLSKRHIVIESLFGGYTCLFFQSHWSLSIMQLCLCYVTSLIFITSFWSDFCYFEIYMTLFIPLFVLWLILVTINHLPLYIIPAICCFIIGKCSIIQHYMGEGDFIFMSWLLLFIPLSTFMIVLFITSIFGLIVAFLPRFWEKQALPFIPCLTFGYLCLYIYSLIFLNHVMIIM